MPCYCLAILTSPCAPEDFEASPAAETLAQYRSRHPERTDSYWRFETYFDAYLPAREERFEPRSGPLWSVVIRSVEVIFSKDLVFRRRSGITIRQSQDRESAVMSGQTHCRERGRRSPPSPPRR